jgi:hypothetical protein
MSAMELPSGRGRVVPPCPVFVAVFSMPLIGRINSWVILVCVGLWFEWISALLLFGGSLVVMSLVRPCC